MRQHGWEVARGHLIPARHRMACDTPVGQRHSHHCHVIMQPYGVLLLLLLPPSCT
jgi:hypothetical protein